jgi:hypothetical protein
MGSWGTLGPALLSLAGVALGAGGSLLGQYLVSRASTRQLEIQESAAHRAELKNVILKFLSIASRLEKAVLTSPHVGVGAADPVIDRLVDDLWLAHAEIDPRRARRGVRAARAAGALL